MSSKKLSFNLSPLVFLALVVVVSGCVTLSSDTGEQALEENIRQNAEEVPYSNLANYPDRVRGDAVKGRGRVIQSWNTSSGGKGIINTVAIEIPNRICGTAGCFISGTELKYTRGTLYADFKSAPPENETLVNYWGIARGTKTYKNVNGKYRTVPQLDVIAYNKSNASLIIPE